MVTLYYIYLYVFHNFIKICISFIKQQNKNAQANKRHIKGERFPGKAPIDPEKLEQYTRGEGLGKGVRHPLHALKLKKRENKFKYAEEQATRADILKTEDQG